MPDETKISITEITILSGKTKGFKLNVDDVQVVVPIDEALFTNYQNQFYRPAPTASQRQRFSTLMGLLRAAYKKGLADGKKR